MSVRILKANVKLVANSLMPNRLLHLQRSGIISAVIIFQCPKPSRQICAEKSYTLEGTIEFGITDIVVVIIGSQVELFGGNRPYVSPKFKISQHAVCQIMILRCIRFVLELVLKEFEIRRGLL